MSRHKARLSPLEAQEMCYLKALGSRIGELAAKKKVSIERLAYEAGVAKGYLYDIVKGNGNPSIIILQRIASALEIQPWILLKA